MPCPKPRVAATPVDVIPVGIGEVLLIPDLRSVEQQHGKRTLGHGAAVEFDVLGDVPGLDRGGRLVAQGLSTAPGISPDRRRSRR